MERQMNNNMRLRCVALHCLALYCSALLCCIVLGFIILDRTGRAGVKWDGIGLVGFSWTGLD
eukprot:scaffold358563_cov22-Prasinocladus_malaysianus.AAC.1